MDDARKFNIRDDESRLLCPACGFPDAFAYPAYDEQSSLAGSGICGCCHWEPGFDDIPAASGAAGASILDCLRNYRRGWTSFGPAWSGRPAEIPTGWNGKAQIEGLFAIAPWVR